MTPASRCIAAAQVAALTDAHNRHADRMRLMHGPRPDCAVEALTQVARALARQHAPRHDTGLYALSDTEALYARRLLLQATMAAFGDTADGRLLRALDAWGTLGGRQHSYTESDARELEHIGEALTGAAIEIAEEIMTLRGVIDGD